MNRIIIFILLTFIAGCGSKNDFSKPPKINLGQDACSRCGMIINELKYAGTLWLSNGKEERFDDIGEMMEQINENEKNVKAAWVYDFETERPIPIKEAFYIKNDKISTPMGSGLIAFESRDEAEKFSKNYMAKVMSFKELKNNNQ